MAKLRAFGVFGGFGGEEYFLHLVVLGEEVIEGRS